MRVVDLLRPYEDGLVRIVDETPEAINIRRHIFASDDVAYERSKPDASGEVAPGTIVITVLGPDRQQHGDPDAVAAVARRLQPGARAIVLFGWEPIELPYHRILDTLTANRCQVLQVAGVDLGSIRTAAVIERVDELQAPRNALGEPLAPGADASNGADRLALELRMANEFVFGDFAARVLRTTVLDPARGIDRRRFEEYRTETEAALKERDERISKLETKLANLNSSSSLKLGQTLARAARSPRRLIVLPVDLVRIWRGRG